MKEFLFMLGESGFVRWFPFVVAWVFMVLYFKKNQKYRDLFDLIKTMSIMRQSGDRYSFEDCFCYVKFMCYRTRGDVFVSFHDCKSFLKNVRSGKEELVEEGHVYRFIKFVCDEFRTGKMNVRKYNVNGLEELYERHKDEVMFKGEEDGGKDNG